MPVKVLIDTNVALDLLLEREPFVESAILLFEPTGQGNLAASIAAISITNIFYIVRKAEGHEVALAVINRLLVGFQFYAVDRQTIETALDVRLKDFEDSVQFACVILN